VGPNNKKMKFEELKRFFIHSDGASSHFKSRYTLFSLFKLFKGRAVMWEFGAAGHGKGPWDGIFAVMKTMLRRWETKEICYMANAWEVYKELNKHYTSTDSNARLTPEDGIEEIVLWYVTGPKDHDLKINQASPYVLGPVVRPLNDLTRLEVSKIERHSKKILCLSDRPERSRLDVAGRVLAPLRALQCVELRQLQGQNRVDFYQDDFVLSRR
jgi:hypothetical protein